MNGGREKGEGRREKGEGRREKGEGRRENLPHGRPDDSARRNEKGKVLVFSPIPAPLPGFSVPLRGPLRESPGWHPGRSLALVLLVKKPLRRWDAERQNGFRFIRESVGRAGGVGRSGDQHRGHRGALFWRRHMGGYRVTTFFLRGPLWNERHPKKQPPWPSLFGADPRENKEWQGMVLFFTLKPELWTIFNRGLNIEYQG